MKAIKQAVRARGANRGGCGGGVERTDPDYVGKKLARLKRDYAALAPEWRATFLEGLSRFEKKFVTRQERTQ